VRSRITKPTRLHRFTKRAAYSRTMGRVAVDLVEALVGVGCVALGVALWRGGGWLRLAAVVLTVAGLAALAHAAVSLAT
jgi:hypothetical protein